jgi:hypothetical protein
VPLLSNCTPEFLPPYTNKLYYDEAQEYSRQSVCKYPVLYEDSFPDIPYIPLYDYTQYPNKVTYSQTLTNGYGDNPFDLTSNMADTQKKQLNHRQKAVYHDANTYNAVTMELKKQLTKPNFGLKSIKTISNINPNLNTCTINFEDHFKF